MNRTDLKWLYFALLILNVNSGLSATSEPIYESSFLGLTPRLNAEASGGTLSLLDGDAMLPLFAGMSQNFYTDAQAEYDNDQNWSGGLGLGFRQVYEQRRILGAYIFGDYNSFNNGSDNQRGIFWVVNPGVESLGNLWDFRVNGYFPVSDETQTVASNPYYFFAGHQEFSQPINTFNYDGPGVDAEIGRVNVPFIKDLRVYVGGYYFAPKDQTDITGFASRAEYSFGHAVALTMGDNYDNYAHNTFQVGIRFTLGGIPTDKSGTSIDRRLMDPVTRNIATLAKANTVPIVTNTQISGTPTVVLNDIYFFNSVAGATFNAAAGSNNCTFENPCIGTSFNQSSVNAIAGFTPNANFFFTPGTYSLNTQLALNSGQSMFGRTWDYLQPASGDGRPVFTGGLALANSNTLDSFILTNDTSFQTIGIDATNSSNILMNNITVGSNSSLSESYTNGVNLVNATNVAINNSQILSNINVGGSPIAIGITADASIFSLNNTTVSTNASSTFTATAIPVFMTNNSQATIQNSQLFAAATAETLTFALGISSDSGSVNISNSTVGASATSISDSSTAQANASGMSLVNTTGTITGTQIVSSAQADSSFGAVVSSNGVEAVASQINLTNSIVEAIGLSDGNSFIPNEAVAVNASGGSSVTISQSSLTANNTSNTTAEADAFATQSVGGTLDISETEMAANATSVGAARALGATSSGTSINITNTSIDAIANADGTSNTAISEAAGVLNSGAPTTLDNVSINVESNATSTATAIAQATGVDAPGTNITVTNSDLTVLSNTAGTATGSSTAIGIDVTGGTLDQSGNIFNVNATGSTPTSENDIVGP